MNESSSHSPVELWPEGRALPPYQIKHSNRARQARVRVCARRGVTVIVPRGFPIKYVERMLHQKQHWLRRSIERLQPVRQRYQASCHLPEFLSLPALAADWRIHYLRANGQRATWRERGDALYLYALDDKVDGYQSLLVAWLRNKAAGLLTPWLQRLSQQSGLAYQRISIRGQTSRWGSCSARGSISLNYKLLFIAPELVEYVLWHELCHTREMNHGVRFWQLLCQWSPQARALDGQLDAAWQGLPGWLDAPLPVLASRPCGADAAIG